MPCALLFPYTCIRHVLMQAWCFLFLYSMARCNMPCLPVGQYLRCALLRLSAVLVGRKPQAV